MKRIISALAVMSLIVISPALAATDTEPFDITAVVDGGTTMQVQLFRGIGGDNFAESVSGSTVALGSLVETGGVLNGAKYVHAYTTMNNHQAGVYTLKSTASAPNDGTGTLIPAASFTIDAVKLTADNGGLDQGTVALSGPSTAVATDKLVYTSAGANKLYTVRVYYGIVNVPVDQKAGTYTSNVVLTMTG